MSGQKYFPYLALRVQHKEIAQNAHLGHSLTRILSSLSRMGMRESGGWTNGMGMSYLIAKRYQWNNGIVNCMLKVCPGSQNGQKAHSLSRMWASASQEGGGGVLLGVAS